MRIVDAGTGQLDSEVYLGDVFSTPRCLAWSPVGRVLACGCGGGGLYIVSVDSGEATEVPTDSSRPVQCVAWC